MTIETKLREELLECKKAHAHLQFKYQQSIMEGPKLKVMARVHVIILFLMYSLE